MSYKAMAHIHSLNGEMTEITVLEEVGDNDYIVDYKGVKCHALFNWFNCTYYDDVYTQKKTATPDTRFVTQLKSSVKATA